MKKITYLLALLVASAVSSYGQCINTNASPSNAVPSNNSGLIQEITTCNYTTEYATISDITAGGDYIFTCVAQEDDAHKYITVTDDANVPIAHGMSPLTVENITSGTIRLHFTEDAACTTQEMCHVTTIFAVLSCPLPLDVAISAITTTGATFAWTAGGTETAWQALIQPNGAPAPTSATAGTPVTGGPLYSTTTLNPGVPYQFYVRANCGSEFSPWAGPYNFSAACPPFTVFNESFEAAETEALPPCWTALYVDAGEDARIETIDFMSHTGDQALQIANGDSDATANLMLLSPPLSTMATGTHRVKFYARGYSNVTLEVGTVTTMTSDAVFTLAETIEVSDVYEEYVVDFSDYAGTDTFLAFRHANLQTYNPIFLDDIKWELTPLCADVTNLMMMAVTPATATVAWEAGGTETQWDVVYGPLTATNPDILTPISPAPAGTPAGTITGLTPDTTYNAWVRSACGGALGIGVWIGPITFTTACLPTGLLNENFNATDGGELPQCWSAVKYGENLSPYANVEVVTDSGLADSNAVNLFNDDSASDATIMLVSPNLSTVPAGTHRLKFYARTQGVGSIDVGTINTAAEGGIFSSIEVVPLTEDFVEYTVSFTSYTGTDTYVALKHTGEIYVSIYIDNLRWEVAPLCADVTEIAVGGITPNTAVITWTPNALETQWDVVVGAQSVSDPATLTPITPAPTGTPAATLTGLTPNTRYNVWVRSVCGGANGTGAWIGPVAFKTACVPTGYVDEGFETTDYGDVPDCWTALLYGPTLPEYAAVRAVDFQAATGENSLELWTDEALADDYVMLVSPNLNTIATATHRLKFSAFSYDPATISIGTLNGATADAVFTPFEEVATGDEYGNFIIDFTTYVGTDTYLAFRNISESTSIFIDDIRWEPKPACADVQNVAVGQVTTNSATVTWSVDGPETGWQVAYGAATVTDPATLTPSPVITVPTQSLTLLTDDTAYKVWVRSVCGSAGNGAWMGPVALHTLCVPGTLPYTQDFESADEALPGCTTIQNAGEANDWFVEEDPGSGFTNNTLVYRYDTEEDANAWFFTRGLPLTAGVSYTLSYKYGNNSESQYVESLAVLYGTSPDENMMTVPLADHPEVGSAVPAVNQVTFIPATTGVYYFGFQAYSVADQDRLFVDDISVKTTLGTPDVTRSTFTYYPNPVKDVLKLSYSEAITNVTVYNLLGQAVLNTAANQNEASVDMSRLAAGSYIVKVTAGAVTKTIKVIKQ